MNIDFATLEAIAAEVEARPRSNYSGRGMYGKSCVGFVLDNESELLALGAIIAEMVEDPKLRNSLLRGSRIDSLGLGIIVYYPTITCDDAEYEEEEEE